MYLKIGKFIEGHGKGLAENFVQNDVRESIGGQMNGHWTVRRTQETKR